MKQNYTLPLGTNFVFDDEKKLLTLTSLAGMSCGHNGLEDDFSCSGLALISVDDMRLEGAKLVYGIGQVKDNEFSFYATDKNNTVRMDFVWKFETAYKLISCKCSLSNLSSRQVVIRRAMPRIVFSPGEYEVTYHMNRWGAENQTQHHKLRGADIVLHGRAARSTVGCTPFCVLKDEENSSAVAFHVLPVGNWMIKIHADILNNEATTPIFEGGLSDTDLFMDLAPGAVLELPELLVQEVPNADICISGADLHSYFIEKRLPSFIHQPPVIYNTWLYRFTHFTVEQLRLQLKAAKEVGCEIFVIDAGWFGADQSWGKVGDWREKENEPFFGNMSAFADEVRAAGLGFGFWIEPERWADAIPIRGEHPEWFPENSTRIDMTIPAAAEHFHDVIADNVRKFGAKYIKVDFNASVGYDASGAELYDYCKSVNTQFERIRAEFPDLIIENCGSGALRNDLATQLIYDHDFISDNANPFETLRIRQGAFMRVLPGRILNWLVMRSAPERRTKVADFIQVLACNYGTWDEAGLYDLDYVMMSGLLGIPGFSGDLAELSDEVKARIAEYVAFYKENRSFIADSHAYLLTPPDETVVDYEKYLVFQMQRHRSTDSLVFVFTSRSSHRGLRKFKLNNLDPSKTYKVRKLFADEPEITVGGEELMRYGITTEIPENQHIRHGSALYLVCEG